MPSGDTLTPAVVSGLAPYTGTIPAGSTTPTVTHGLGTTQVDVTVRDSSGNEVQVPNQAISTTQVQFTFTTAPTANQYTTRIEGGSSSGGYVPPPGALTDAATITTDASVGNYFRVTLGGNRTLANPTNPTDGQKVIWELIQDATGSRTITLDTAFAVGSTIGTITLTTTASKRDFLGAIYNAVTSKWYVLALSKGY
jgi:hypothetical protein